MAKKYQAHFHLSILNVSSTMFFQNKMSRTLRIGILFVALIFPALLLAQSFTTVYERSGGKQSGTYAQIMDGYQNLVSHYPSLQMQEIGNTDANLPLHVVYYSNDRTFSIDKWKQQNKVILLVNNGIHPGESDGIDASFMLLRDAAMGKISIPSNVIVAVIPVFNIGGMLNRGSFSRANQNGPEAYGFRGSAQNLDLNRDFIKMDARETRSLVSFFHRLDPDIFIDNHVSNGADYQHIMTLLSTHEKKQGGVLGQYLKDHLQPAIFASMEQKGYTMSPYVNHWGHTPDKGWMQFYDPPRFTSGFVPLFRTFAFVPEAHMLKPYQQRVSATYALLLSFIQYASQHAADILSARQKELEWMLAQREWVLDWKVDTTQHSTIPFMGYEAAYKPSEVSGKPRLYYDRSKPYTLMVPYYNTFVPTQKVNVPQYYVLPQGWQKVVHRLQINGVNMQPIQRDTTLTVTVYRILNYETVKKPYEGHYLHSNVTYQTEKSTLIFRKGDWLIPTQQKAKRYLLETLEPHAPDAFFAWNFFDAVLQQKEYFSDYVFEDEASIYLKNHPVVLDALNKKQKSDTAFANNSAAQLDFVYRNSPYLEPEYMRYPVFRID